MSKKGGSGSAAAPKPAAAAISSLPKMTSPIKAAGANKSATAPTKSSPANASLPFIASKFSLSAPQVAAVSVTTLEMADTILTTAEGNNDKEASNSVALDSAAAPAVPAVSSTADDSALSSAVFSKELGTIPKNATNFATAPDTATTIITGSPPPAAPAMEIMEPLEDGQVTLLYEQYNEQFPISASSLTANEIDEVYCLSFVMPACRIRLSPLAPAEKRKKEIELEEAGLGLIEREKQLLLVEEPKGTFHGLRNRGSYYVYAEQAAEQLAIDQARARELFAIDQTQQQAINSKKDDGRVIESCSCLYGNPCIDEYGCRDWGNRYAVAKLNGWKGF